MKNYLLLTISVLISISLNADELQWVQTQIQAIKPPRVGVTHQEIKSLSDPFSIFKTQTSKKRSSTNNTLRDNSTYSSRSYSKKRKSLKKFSLLAIMNNSALINGKWYRQNEKIGNYTIVSVKTSSVDLHSKHNKKTLYIPKSKKLNFKNQ